MVAFQFVKWTKKDTVGGKNVVFIGFYHKVLSRIHLTLNVLVILIIFTNFGPSHYVL